MAQLFQMVTFVNRRYILTGLAALVACVCPATAEYHNNDQLQSQLKQLVESHPTTATLATFGTSRAGQPLWVLTLAGGVEDASPDDRSSILLTAGLDGDHLVGSEVAVLIAKRLLEKHASGDEQAVDLLNAHTVYVIPRVNPDALERYFESPRSDMRTNLRPVDDDRDGSVDEDGPNDLNGDGWITMMRVRDPEGTYLADSDEPRLLRLADRTAGERPVFKLYVEGIDDDGDGEYNEDPVGGVDLNANFPHQYQEHQPTTGPFQLSEPESHALAEFVVAHRRIAIVVALGRQDNLVAIDESGKKDATEQAPITLDEGDVAIYKHIAERYKELTNIKKAPKQSQSGAFHAWTYAQLGIPSFASRVWVRPQAEKKTKDGNGDKDREPEGKSDDKNGDATSADNGGSGSRPRRGGFRRGRRGGRRAGGPDGRAGKKNEKKKDKEAFEQAKGWLKYSDEQRDGAGFVVWEPFEHPTLGAVEIGGFVPYFRTNPPADQLGDIADAQTKFLLDLGGRFPHLSLERVEVNRLSDSVYEIKAFLTNSGYFPSGLAIAKVTRRVRPVVVSLGLDLADILGGDKIHKVWNVDGEGGVYELRWVVRGRANQTIAIHVTSEKYGDFTKEVALVDSANRQSGGTR